MYTKLLMLRVRVLSNEVRTVELLLDIQIIDDYTALYLGAREFFILDEADVP